MSPDTMIYVKIGGKKYTLPVNPEEIEVSHATNDQTADVAGVGEALIPQKPGLREVTFQSFFPGAGEDPYTHNYRNPRTLARAFEKAWRDRTKCRLIISRSNDYDTNMQCVIEEWKCSDRGGEPNDLYYSVTFREYRSFGVSQMTVVSSSGTGAGAVSGPGSDLTAADGALSVRVTASTTTVREMDSPQYVVGAPVVLNGAFYYDSAATREHSFANDIRATIARIDNTQPAPYYVSNFGWFRAESVQLVG